VSAIGRFALAIVIAAGFSACGQSESDSSAPAKNPAVVRWQAEISNPAGRRQQCVMDVGDTGQIAYGDRCPMPLTGQQATIATVPNGCAP